VKSKNEMVKRDILGELKREAETVHMIFRRYEEQLNLRDSVMSELAFAVVSLSKRVDVLEAGHNSSPSTKSNSRILDLI
jgi:hypothetical protein